jgi:hypothetical protein
MGKNNNVWIHREVSVKYDVQGMTIMFLKYLNRCHLKKDVSNKKAEL